MCDLLGVKHTKAMGLACTVAATAAATSAEAILLSVLEDGKATDKDRKARVKSCLDTITAHTKTFSHDVKAMVMPGVYEKAVGVLLS